MKRVRLFHGSVHQFVRVLKPIKRLTFTTQRFCQSASPAEAQEALNGIRERCIKLGIDLPKILTVDNCCSVRAYLLKAIAGLEVVLDVYHFMMRYAFGINLQLMIPNMVFAGI